MVGALGVVGSAVGASRQRRDSKNSNHENEGAGGRRQTISKILASRHVLSAGGLNLPPYDPTCGIKINEKPQDPPPENLSLREKIKFYVSVAFGILATICVFALLFLIPLVVEPSISTILADFDPEPASCVTIDSSVVTGLTKCAIFSSCREGCTSKPTQCYQIYVNYRRANKKGFPQLKNFSILPTSEWMDESKWDESYTELLINVKGCGYPPRVKCDEFGEVYGKEGRVFSCFYSRSNPRLVVTDYNWEETAYPLLTALGLPCLIFTISISFLSVWYCPSCEERGKNKRPCRSKYAMHRPRPSEILKDECKLEKKEKKSLNNNAFKENDAQNNGITPVMHQPLRRKISLYNPNSPSLATISSGDTTISSVSSLDEGWNSPPTPPFNSKRTIGSFSNRTRQL